MICAIIIFAVGLLAVVLGGVTKDDISGRYQLISSDRSLSFSFCDFEMEVMATNGVVNKNGLKFNDKRPCTSGNLTFEFVGDTNPLTNDSDSLGAMLISPENGLVCGGESVGAMLIRPMKNTEVDYFVYPGMRKYIKLFANEGLAECYYGEEIIESPSPVPAAKPKRKKSSKPAKPVVKSGTATRWRWLAPLVTFLALIPIFVCCIWWCLKRRRNSRSQFEKPSSTIPQPPTPRRIAPASPPVLRLTAPPLIATSTPPILHISSVAPQTSQISPHIEDNNRVQIEEV